MITVKTNLKNGEVELTNEWFEPVFKDWWSSLGIPFKKLVAFKGQDTGTLLHPDFDDILEIR